MPSQFPALTITRAGAGTPVRVTGRLRVAGNRTIDASVDVPEDGTLSDEELIEAALVLLRDKQPGARWTDPHAAAATASITGDRRPVAWLFRFPLYLLLWTVLIAPASYAIEHAFRESVIVPACTQWGRDRGVRFASYSHGGGEWHDVFKLTGSYSAPGCYFTGGHPDFATLREVGGGRLSWIAVLGGPGSVLAAFVGTTLIVVLVAWVVEAALRRFRPRP